MLSPSFSFCLAPSSPRYFDIRPLPIAEITQKLYRNYAEIECIHAFIHSNTLQPNDVNSCAFQPNQTRPCTLCVQNPSIHFSQLGLGLGLGLDSYSQTNKPTSMHSSHDSFTHSFIRSFFKQIPASFSSTRRRDSILRSALHHP